MPSKQKQLAFRLTEEEYKLFLKYKATSKQPFENGVAKELFLKGLREHNPEIIFARICRLKDGSYTKEEIGIDGVPISPEKGIP